MTVRVRFFAQFREFFGADIPVEPEGGTTLTALVREIARTDQKGYDAVFDEQGNFREFVILMRNGKRLENADADAITVTDGDEIAVFPPVAGG